MKKLAERLAWARERSGMTQQELAEKSRVAQSTIASWESGARETGRKISSVADALGVNALWLSEGRGESGIKEGQAHPQKLNQSPGPEPKTKGASHVILAARDNSGEFVELVTLYARANQAQRDDILQTARLLTSRKPAKATDVGKKL